MAAELQRLITICKEHDPSFEICLSEQWGSNSNDHRLLIRKNLLERFPNEAALMDLSKPPRPMSHSVSISHTQNLGGWAATIRPRQIGFDLELTERIKRPAVERICDDEELEACPEFPRLWGAKESLYKALEGSQPKVISEIKIHRWAELGPSLYRFESLAYPHASGLSLRSGVLIYSICLL